MSVAELASTPRPARPPLVPDGSYGLATLARVVATATWAHQGAFAKLADGQPWQAEVIAQLPGIGPRRARAATCTVGVAELALAAWTCSGRTPRANAVAQTLALAGVKLGGRAVTGRWQPDPGRATLSAGVGLLCAGTTATAPRPSRAALPGDRAPNPRTEVRS